MSEDVCECVTVFLNVCVCKCVRRGTDGDKQ